MRFAVKQQLPSHDVVAKNYGADHANKIHSDEGAAQYGFAGALVPGVALYAYLTRPVVAMLGPRWLELGAMSAKFLKPVYDGDQVQARAVVANVDPIAFDLQLINAAGTPCAVGSAGLPKDAPDINAKEYPHRALPDVDHRLPPTIASFVVGDALGAIESIVNWNDETFLGEMAESLRLYAQAAHPALWPALANEVLMQNIALGPWIHTASETRHLALPHDGERIELRGRVVELQEKRGHEIIVADLCAFGDGERPLVQIRHSAIIKIGLQ